MSHIPVKETRNRMYCKREDGSFQCKICNKVTEKQNTMSIHVTTKHTSRRDHECPDCGELFVQSSALRSHMKIHNETEKHICGIDGCDVECSAVSNLYVHVMRAHFEKDCKTYGIETEDEVGKRFSCGHCEKGFNSQTALYYHLFNCIGPGSLC